MTSSAAEHLETTSYNKQMPWEAGPAEIIQVSSTTIPNDEDSIQNSVSIDWATPAPLAKYVERQFVQAPDEPVDKLEDRVDAGGGQTTTEELADAVPAYAGNPIVHHVCVGDNVRYVARWYDYTSADGKVEHFQYIPFHYIIRYWWVLNKNDTGQKLRG